MKRTSIFFLIVAVILIITGFILVNTASKVAEKDNIKLYKQTLSENGDLIEKIEFPSDSTNKINISLPDTDVNIYGGSKKTYIEIINFNALDYSAYVNNRALTVENDLLSSIVNRAEGGSIKFNGVRDYIINNKHNKTKKVNIYISSESAIKIIDIKITNGNINIDKANWICDYNILLRNGNLTIKNTPQISLLKADIKKGNVKLDNIFISSADIDIQNGNLDFSTPANIIYDYMVVNETGEIKYNNEKFKGKFAVENTNINGTINANIGVGKVTIRSDKPDFAFPEIPETPETTTENTQ